VSRLERTDARFELDYLDAGLKRLGKTIFFRVVESAAIGFCESYQPTVAVTARIGLTVFFPHRLQGQMPMLLELLMDSSPVGFWS
jgi:hypothetical protein